jgi:hypothetical protein
MLLVETTSRGHFSTSQLSSQLAAPRNATHSPSPVLAIRFPMLLACVALWGCKTAPAEAPDAAPSPQATAEPALLANPPLAPTANPADVDAGHTPEPLRGDQGLAPDVWREPSVREGGLREASRDPRGPLGYTLQATIRTGEGPAAPRGPEVNVGAIDAAKRRSEARMSIAFSQGRARFLLQGGAFVLPPATELRSRSDRYGHLLFLPGEDVYRVVESGSLRALLGERRLDVAPLSPAEVAPAGESVRRLGLRTRRVDVSTRAARAVLEIATVHDAGDGGPLVCRFLLDLMSAPPSIAVCAADEVPLHAELRWTTQGSLVFDATSIARTLDLAPQDMAAPPASVSFTAAAPPPSPAELLVPRAELAAFRTGPVDVPIPGGVAAGRPAPEAGLSLSNTTDELRVVWVDGVPVAWVGPGERMLLPGLLRGRYALQWRTMLGDAWDPGALVTCPGASEAGATRAAGP